MLIGLMRAMTIFHSKNMLHRDLKPMNVLVGIDGRIKLADMGLVTDVKSTILNNAIVSTRMASNVHLNNVGTLNFLSPEIILRRD